MNTHNPADIDAASDLLACRLAATARGDRSAFRALHDATCARLLGIAFEVLASRERAEEALQDAYMKVWRSAGQFDAGIARPMTWLMRIVRHTAIDHLRARRSEAAITVPLCDAVSDTVADPAPLPEQRWHQTRQRERLEGILPRLGRAERQAVAQVLYRGTAPGEAAELCGLPLDQSRLPLRRAITQIRRHLQPAALCPA